MKLKYFLSLFLISVFLLTACQDKKEDTKKDEQNNDEMFVDKKDTDGNIEIKKEEESNIVVYKRTEEKDYFYHLLTTMISSATNNKNLNNLQDFKNNRNLNSKVDDNPNVILLSLYIDYLINLDETDFNDDEKEIKKILLEYIELQKEFLIYIEPFINENNELIIPLTEEEMYKNKITKMNDLFIQNKHLILETVQLYGDTKIEDYTREEEIINYINEQLEKGEQTFAYKLENNQNNQLTEEGINQIMNEYPLFALLIYKEGILSCLEEKNKECIYLGLSELKNYIEKAENIQYNEYSDLYMEYIKSIKEFMTNTEFLDSVEKDDYSKAINIYMNHYFNNNKLIEKSMNSDVVYFLRNTINELEKEMKYSNE